MEKQIGIQKAQYLGFGLRGEEFAVPINKVREVLEGGALTRIPRTPPFMQGVLNLRGKVVPVLDLGCKLGLAPIVTAADSRIIIFEIASGEGMIQLGAMTDSVRAVIDIAEEEIEPLPEMGAAVSLEFICGMARHDEKFLILLDVDRILTDAEISAMQRRGGEGIAADSDDHGRFMAAGY